MGRLTTHVLDTAQGIPAAGVAIELHRVGAEHRMAIGQVTTNADGRVDRALLEDDAFQAGTYELTFDVGSYFARQPVTTADPPFLTLVTIRFTVADPAAHYHVPLLVSPWAYSTYRGS
jgi:5-hydroxyisourate hydrolase